MVQHRADRLGGLATLARRFLEFQRLRFAAGGQAGDFFAGHRGSNGSGWDKRRWLRLRCDGATDARAGRALPNGVNATETPRSPSRRVGWSSPATWPPRCGRFSARLSWRPLRPLPLRQSAERRRAGRRPRAAYAPPKPALPGRGSAEHRVGEQEREAQEHGEVPPLPGPPDGRDLFGEPNFEFAHAVIEPVQTAIDRAQFAPDLVELFRISWSSLLTTQSVADSRGAEPRRMSATGAAAPVCGIGVPEGGAGRGAEGWSAGEGDASGMREVTIFMPRA